MAFAFPEIKSFSGLALQQNSLTVPDGALETATNVVVSKDGQITKRRGFYTYFTPSSGTLGNLFQYQSTLLAAYANKLTYLTDTGTAPNKTGTETALSGQTVAISPPRVARRVEANRNFYFTTDGGVLKLTGFSSALGRSGAPGGLDLAARFIPSSTSAGIFAAGMTWGYRVLFGYRDANDNLILSAPSDIVILTNASTLQATATVVGTTVTVTSLGHGLTTGMYLTFSGATGFTTPANAQGTYQITVTGVDTFTYVVPVMAGAAPGAVDYAYGGPVRLEFSIPSEIAAADSYFAQIYRSSQVATGLIFSDFKMIDEVALTAAQLTARVVIYTDDVPDLLLGAELYTNQNSREGELQANTRAPLAVDLALYKGHTIYAGATTRQLVELSVIDATLIVAGDYVEVKVDATTRRYVARSGVGNQTASAASVSGAGPIVVTSIAHGLVAPDTVYLSSIVGGTYADQTATITSATADTFTLAVVGAGSPTALDFQGVTNGTYPIFTVSQSSSAAVRLRDTARQLVKAINRDTVSLVYAQYVSGISDIPGRLRLSAKGFTGVVYLRASTAAAAAAFSPVLPTSFAAGTQVYSRGDALPHAFFSSKGQEPEAVPLVNFFPVGAANKAILRVAALRDSLIVIKEDGVFRVTGDTPANFSSTSLDSTVVCLAPSSVDVLNNQVIFLSNQGVCLVTESSVQIVSRKIEDVIQTILGQANLSVVTAAVGYESERLYLVTTSDPNDLAAVNCWAFNLQTEAWTLWDTLFIEAAIGPSDRLYYVSLANTILRERKDQTRLDYTGESAAVTVVSAVDSTAQVTITGAVVPRTGDVIVKQSVINRIVSTPVLVSGTTYDITFVRRTNLEAADTAILYRHYVSEVKLAPFHAGLVGRVKQFSIMEVHFRDRASASRVGCYFAGPTAGGSATIDWTASFATLGWGLFPWGSEPWGQGEGINLPIGTQAASVLRTYVPVSQARGVWIQPVLEHAEAAESLSIQAMTFGVRAYGERVSR